LNGHRRVSGGPSSLPRRRAAENTYRPVVEMIPDHRSAAVPDSNHHFPGRRPGVLALGPQDRMSDRGGRRTHKITRLSGTDRRLVAPLCLFAYPAASGRPGGRTRRSELMRLRWTLVRLRQLKVTKGRVEPPCLAARRSERRVYPSSTTWSCVE
jgi:hypothetical protein